MARKFEALPEEAQRTVSDFIDFLIEKEKKRQRKVDDKKKKLLEISQWDDKDIKAVEVAGKEINKWKPEAF